MMQYPFLKARMGVWKEIVRYVAKDVGAVESLVELGPGYCDFINQYPARRRICYELNEQMRVWARDDVDLRTKSALAMSEIGKEKVDLVFASNFLEHLGNDDLDQLMPAMNAVLRPQGKVVLIQPNYRLCQKDYFCDPTHQTIFSDENIAAFLKKFGFAINKLVPNLLPFSMKSRLPKWSFLVRLYLLSPVRPGAAQMYVVARKGENYLER